MAPNQKFELVIRFLDDGHTKLKTANGYAMYNQLGAKVREENPSKACPFPDILTIFGKPKSEISHDHIQSILRHADACDKPEPQIYEFNTSTKELPSEHDLLFKKLKTVLIENAPTDGEFSLSLHFSPHQTQDEEEAEPENPVEPNDVQLAILLALLNSQGQAH